ncbi:MAG: alanine dehydrogenase [Spongiibacteraceae bacterium]
MIIGVPREVKAQEYRVALAPTEVAALCAAGHHVLVSANAGFEAGFGDDRYLAAGAEILTDNLELYRRADLLVKVKEPQAEEYALLRPGQRLFCYLHLAPNPVLTDALLASGADCIAFETISDDSGRLPLLKPMSEIAGRIAVQAGAHCLEKAQGGAGVLLAGVAGLPPARVLIIGGGVVGCNAADVALGMGAEVLIVEPQAARRAAIEAEFSSSRLSLLDAIPEVKGELLASVDMVIGAALSPGASAPKILSVDDLGLLRLGSVLVDVAVDQGGCFASTRPTTHGEPTFVRDGVVHYCVANIPSAVAQTASRALSAAILPYVLRLAADDLAAVLAADPGLAAGLNIAAGQIRCAAVADAQNR